MLTVETLITGLRGAGKTAALYDAIAGRDGLVLVRPSAAAEIGTSGPTLEIGSVMDIETHLDGRKIDVLCIDDADKFDEAVLARLRTIRSCDVIMTAHPGWTPPPRTARPEPLLAADIYIHCGHQRGTDLLTWKEVALASLHEADRAELEAWQVKINARRDAVPANHSYRPSCHHYVGRYGPNHEEITKGPPTCPDCGAAWWKVPLFIPGRGQ